MRIVILKENLLFGLNTTNRVISSSSKLPILENLLLTVNESQVKLSATNLEVSINVFLNAKIEKRGNVVIPAKTFQEIVTLFPADKLTLFFQDGQLKIESRSHKVSLNTVPSIDFPKLPVFEGEADVEIDNVIFTEAIPQVVFAAAQDEGRPVLTGVKFKNEEGVLVLATTDGYRLSVKKMKNVKYPFKEELIIPAQTLTEINRAAGKQEKIMIKIISQKKQIIFKSGDIEVASQLIAGEFPEYEKIIPAAFNTQVVVDREELLQSVKIASIFARETANIVKFKTENKQLLINANAPQIGTNTGFVDVSVEGEETEIAFNFRFVIDYLNSINSQDVVLETSGPLKPGVFKQKGNDSFIHIIMPVRVQE